MRISTALTALALLLLPAATTQAQPATEVELELVLSGMSNTVDLQSAGDSRLFAVGRNGVIELITFDNQGVASLDPMPFLDINGLVYSAGGEQGLLGLAFHPEYDANGYFFVNYSCDASEQADCASDGDTIIARYTVSADPDVADPSSAFVVATQSQPGTNHNGGQLQFEPMPDPTDGRTILYIGMGDGGSNGTAQDLSSLLGKMLRVDIDDMDDIPPLPPLPRYFVPTDNPTIDGVKDEIWAYGLRNPWRNSFDRLTGDFFIADVGQNNREEVNFQAAASPGGENYGWRQCEGTRVNVAAEAPDGCTGGGGLTPPILEYDHNNGCSITGGYIYRGVEFASELGGTYFYADYCTGELWGARPDGGGGWSNTIDEDTGLRFTIASFGEDNVGELYLTTIAGNLYRIRPIATDQPDLIVTAVDGPTEGNIGETIVVTPTEIENQGVGAAGATEVGYYFTTDPDNVPNQTFSTSVCPIPALGSGESYTCLDITVNVPGSLAAGPHSLVAIVDDQDNVGESDETNNDLADLQQILLSCIDGGNACISDAQCCSNKCRGGGGNKTCKGGSTSCTPSEDPEISCSDGQDNDCDGLTDTSDPDCGGGSCEPKGDFCTVDSQCCSNKCRGPSGNKSCK